MAKKLLHYLLITVLLLFFHCKDENKIQVDDPENKDKYLYSQVDQARIRKQSGLSGKAIGFLAEGEKVIFLEEESSETAKVTLRGKKYNSPFLKIETLNGVTGWVYGGALSKEIVQPEKTEPAKIEALYNNIYIGEILPSGSIYLEKISSEQKLCEKPVEDKSLQANIVFFALENQKKMLPENAKFVTNYCGYLPNSEEQSSYFFQPFSEPQLALLHFKASSKPEKTALVFSVFHEQLESIDFSTQGKVRPYSDEEYRAIVESLKEEDDIDEEDRVLEKPTLENTIARAEILCIIKLKNSNMHIRISSYTQIGMEYVANVYVTDFLVNNKVVKTYEKKNWDGPM
ncbi:MAG: SH3 domain-containing protein [Leptospirales bacterium]